VSHALLRSLWLDPAYVRDAFPFTLPAVRPLIGEPLELASEVTFLVGENGTGKSTIVEALAAKLDLDVEGGDRDLRFEEREADTDLHVALRIARGSRRPSMQYFLRAESFFNVARTVDAHEGLLARHGGRPLHAMSHGESFLALANERFLPDGLFVLDEPEAALSPVGQLGLLRRMRELALDGAQFVVATHSPILLAYPGATIYELSDAGIERVGYEQTDHYRLTRAFLEAPERFLGELFA
jgi:predicted ATPase